MGAQLFFFASESTGIVSTSSTAKGDIYFNTGNSGVGLERSQLFGRPAI